MPKTLQSIFLCACKFCMLTRDAQAASISSGNGCKGEVADHLILLPAPWGKRCWAKSTQPCAFHKHPLPLPQPQGNSFFLFFFVCEGRVGVVREGGERGDCPRSMNHWFLLSMDWVQHFPRKEAVTPGAGTEFQKSTQFLGWLLTAEQLLQALHCPGCLL